MAFVRNHMDARMLEYSDAVAIVSGLGQSCTLIHANVPSRLLHNETHCSTCFGDSKHIISMKRGLQVVHYLKHIRLSLLQTTHTSLWQQTGFAKSAYKIYNLGNASRRTTARTDMTLEELISRLHCAIFSMNLSARSQQLQPSSTLNSWKQVSDPRFKDVSAE
ncbi:hypothetical protein BD769DRAFT_1422415 [Suillus cothurnatus]|nr:hypothetical protein BD769DRAFT_1422415 [Suillus cothurnatus]